MHEKRIQNILLAIVSTLLLINLGVMLAPAVHAIPKTQYKAISIKFYAEDPRPIQQALDSQSAQGWEYVDYADGVFVFKK
jgi:hypothetical protein